VSNSSRRIHVRPYFFEIFAAINFLIAMIVLKGWTFVSVGHVVGGTLNLLAHALLSVVIRGAILRLRGRRGYFTAIRRKGWLIDTVRMALFGTLTILTYGWIKLVVPIYHPRLFDQELWNVDQSMLLGASPNLLALDLFANRWVFLTIDTCYAYVFFTSFVVLLGYFLSEPSRRIRVAFSNGNTVLWIAGAWLYLLVPSLGPAFRFPEIWFVYSQWLPRTQYFQAMLMRNYQNVLRMMSGQRADVQLILGIAAFPSLHVAFQTFAFLWMRRLWRSGEVLFGIFAVIILVGSVITGWHYLIDGLAGIVLAVCCYVITVRASRVPRLLDLRK
jgi:hypothetical protein